VFDVLATLSDATFNDTKSPNTAHLSTKKQDHYPVKKKTTSV